jgi:hypothetical protein
MSYFSDKKQSWYHPYDSNQQTYAVCYYLKKTPHQQVIGNLYLTQEFLWECTSYTLAASRPRGTAFTSSLLLQSVRTNCPTSELLPLLGVAGRTFKSKAGQFCDPPEDHRLSSSRVRYRTGPGPASRAFGCDIANYSEAMKPPRSRNEILVPYLPPRVN